MSLYGYTECNDFFGDLRSFTFIVADRKAETRLPLTEIGYSPNRDLTCKGFRLSSNMINKAAIYADSERVYGIRLVSTFDNEASDLGSLTKGDPPVLEEFSGTDQLIGFYGSYTQEIITSIGFITHDPTCEEEVVEEKPEIDDEENIKTETKEDI